jgi:4-hydroxy-4-methyl-2-oxoglutarate aldolase
MSDKVGQGFIDAPAVYEKIERSDPELVRQLSRFGVSTIHEADRRRGYMHEIKPIVSGLSICGPAVTSLDHTGDNLMIHAALEVCQPGDVLVVTTLSPSTHGMFGDLLATLCIARGLAGVIIDAGARDVRDLRAMNFPIWTRTISSQGTAKSNPGWVNVPVICGQVNVRPGDVIAADDDGVVVIPKERLEMVVAAAQAREDNEAKARERFARGELSLDVVNLRLVLERFGVRYPDRENSPGKQS